jgi:dolichol-phosphate mannosyltransferase
VLVGICTYNEATNIRPLIDAIRSELPDADLLVVDDQSPDKTGEIVEEVAAVDSRVHLIVRVNERGLGGATKRAIAEAMEGNYELFVNLDGDFSHNPAHIPRLLERIQTPGENGRVPDVVVGSRYLPGGQIEGWPWHRQVMSRLLNWFATSFLGLPVSDCSGSMRCYRVSALRKIDLTMVRSNGYAVLEELLLALVRSGANISEVPITYTERERGSSKLTFREALRSARQIVALALSRPSF